MNEEIRQKEDVRAPNFKSKSGGWACWVNLDKNGKKYLSVQVEGVGRMNLFANDFKPKPKPDTVIQTIREDIVL